MFAFHVILGVIIQVCRIKYDLFESYVELNTIYLNQSFNHLKLFFLQEVVRMGLFSSYVRVEKAVVSLPEDIFIAPLKDFSSALGLHYVLNFNKSSILHHLSSSNACCNTN